MALTRAEISKRWYYRNLERNRAYFRSKAGTRYHTVTKLNWPLRVCAHCSRKYRGSGKKYCSSLCASKGFVGYRHSDAARSKVSLSLMGRTGPQSRRWGYRSPLRAFPLSVSNNKYSRYLRKTKQWKEWREAVFTRDDYSCKVCGARSGKRADGSVRVEAHHMIAVRKLVRTPFEHHIFNVSNGITLCESCHKAIPTKG
jgi:hypothetical protein